MQSTSDIEDRRRRNDAAPISRLPAEIFEGVIRSVVSESPPGAKSPPEEEEEEESSSRANAAIRQRLGWVELTHVCSTWRTHIIGLQSLWAAFIGAIPSATDEMLSRAGNHTLLTLHTSNPSVAAIRSLDIAPRIARIVTSGELSAQSFQELVSIVPDAPHIETFAVAVTRDSFLASFKLDDTGCSRLYTINAPKLRTLRLENSVAMCTSSALTSLDISYAMSADMRNQYAIPLLQLINRCRETLQILKLRFHSEPMFLSVEDFERREKVWLRLGFVITLPHAHTLTVEDAAGILYCLSVPATAAITVYCCFGLLGYLWNSVARMTFRLALPVSMASRACAVGVSLHDPQELWLKFYSESFDAAHDAPSQPIISFSFSEQHTHRRTLSLDWLESLASVLPDTLSEFGVSPTSMHFENSALFCDPQLAGTIIRSFSSIEHLTVANPHFSDSDPLEALASAEEGLPELAHLTLIGTGEHRDRRFSSIRLKRQLASLLERSTKLERVSVHRSLTSYDSGGYFESDLEDMRNAVRHFDWDIKSG